MTDQLRAPPRAGLPDHPQAPAAFDLAGPLPAGVTVLEASAGTGKTAAIAGLAARYVAAGTPLDQLLLVTFTRNATSELRDRVRERLLATSRGLAAVLAGRPALPGAGDEVTAVIAAGGPEAAASAHRNLVRALADFDAATITTTHAFCQRMLASLGLAAAPDAAGEDEVVADVEDLLAEIVDDRYLRHALVEAMPPFGRAAALAVARAATDTPWTPIAAADAGPGSPERLRVRLARTVRDELARRKRQRGIVTYDDLLTRLADALADGVAGPAAADTLRRRYRVVLVDEFQDTDELQWRILSRAFGHPGRTLVLIGDPKQAIYGFRGADVHAYLAAAHGAERLETLTVNWRSDQGLLDAFHTLFGGARLGHPEIVCRPVIAPLAHRQPGLVGPGVVPLRIRVLHRRDGLVTLTERGHASKRSVREVIAHDLATDVVRLLSGGAELVERDPGGAATGRRPVGPGDVAVLTRTNRSAARWQKELAGAGVPAVLSGAGSVFAAPAATEWLQLLEALERPTSPTRVHALALTPFIGWGAEEAGSAGEERWEELHAACHRWAAVTRRAGVAALFETIAASTDLPARVLEPLDGERHLTDLRHVAELLDAESTVAARGPAALTTWLRERIAGADQDTDVEERIRRLEADTDAVQVLTIHRSKGLEFPVVYLPDLWEQGPGPNGDAPVVYHDQGTPGWPRTLDVAGGHGGAFRRHQAWAREERRGEDLRLAYVALTRARHQAVVWWAGSYDSRSSPLGRLLFQRAADGTIGPGGAPIADDAAVARFAELARAAPGAVEVERVEPPGQARWVPPARPAPTLAVAAFERRLDRSWRRTSYSGLTAGTHEAAVGSEPEEDVLDDEPAGEPAGRGPDPPAGDGWRDVPLPLAGMPGGARVGSLVHAAFEAADFAAADLHAALAEALRSAAARWPVPIGDPATVVEGLARAVETPLGPLAGEARLRDLGRRDRLDELAFELPVAGGDRPARPGQVDLAAVAALLREHLPTGDPLGAYAERLTEPSLASAFRGYLTGSLDLVARLPGPDPRRYVVVDYKTNVLGRDAATRTTWDYRPDALARAMIAAHYPLQALLYSVALHRYLRWRVAAYTPGTHLGGVLYLFVRGMGGPSAPRVAGQPCGVFAWSPPAALVSDLSDLLHSGGMA